MSLSKVNLQLGLSIFCTVQLQAQTDPAAVDLAADHFTAGQNVTVSAPVTEDLLVAGTMGLGAVGLELKQALRLAGR